MSRASKIFSRMEPVLRSAGLELHELREMMIETARRIEDRAQRNDTEGDPGPE